MWAAGRSDEVLWCAVTAALVLKLKYSEQTHVIKIPVIL